jgi:hypothetical protein
MRRRMFVQGSLATAGTLLIGTTAMGKETSPEVLLQHLDEYLFPKFPIVGPGAPPPDLWSIVLHPKMIETLQTYRPDRVCFGEDVGNRPCKIAGSYYESNAMGAYVPYADEHGRGLRRTERGYHVYYSEEVPCEGLCAVAGERWAETGRVLCDLAFGPFDQRLPHP